MSYSVPLKDMLFTLEHVAGIGAVAQLPGLEEAGIDTAAAVLEECAKFNEGVIAPLNWPSDQQPSSLSHGVVTTSPGFVEAFRAYAQAGWQGIQHPGRHRGPLHQQGLGAQFRVVAAHRREMHVLADRQAESQPILLSRDQIGRAHV